jgi:hypothetical protein
MRRKARLLVVLTAGLASSAIAAPYAMWLDITRQAVSNFTQNASPVAIVVTTTTALLTGALAWIATIPRSARNAAWLCTLSPVFGALNAGLAFGVVCAASGSGDDPVARLFFGTLVGGAFGALFAAPMGAAFGLLLAVLVHGFVSLGKGTSLDQLQRTGRWCGAWLVACATLALCFLASTGRSLAWACPAAIGGALLVGGGLLQRRLRARWLSRVRAGDVRGWRVVEVHGGEYDPALPLFDSRQPFCDGVLLRVSNELATYRDASRDIAVARVSLE